MPAAYHNRHDVYSASGAVRVATSSTYRFQRIPWAHSRTPSFAPIRFDRARRYFRNGRGEPDTTDKRLRKSWRAISTRLAQALKKNSDERYVSVEAFSQDVANYRAATRSGPAPTGQAWYRARKFVGRNALPVASTALVVIALLIGSAVALWQAGSPPNNEIELLSLQTA